MRVLRSIAEVTQRATEGLEKSENFAMLDGPKVDVPTGEIILSVWTTTDCQKLQRMVFPVITNLL